MYDKEILSERIFICKSCPELNSLNFCKKCGCFMPAKVRFKTSSCPLNKWSAIITVDNVPSNKNIKANQPNTIIVSKLNITNEILPNDLSKHIPK